MPAKGGGGGGRGGEKERKNQRGRGKQGRQREVGRLVDKTVWRQRSLSGRPAIPVFFLRQEGSGEGAGGKKLGQRVRGRKAGCNSPTIRKILNYPESTENDTTRKVQGSPRPVGFLGFVWGCGARAQSFGWA